MTAEKATTYSANDIEINKDLPEAFKKSLRDTTARYDEVFTKSKDELPRPILGADGEEYIHSHTAQHPSYLSVALSKNNNSDVVRGVKGTE